MTYGSTCGYVNIPAIKSNIQIHSNSMSQFATKSTNFLTLCNKSSQQSSIKNWKNTSQVTSSHRWSAINIIVMRVKVNQRC